MIEEEFLDEEEKRLGIALNTIRMHLIKPYLKLETEEEKEQYNREHPELEKVMAIVEEIDRNNPRNKNKVKQVVKEQKSKGDLGKNKELEKDFDDVIKEKEQAKKENTNERD